MGDDTLEPMDDSLLPLTGAGDKPAVSQAKPVIETLSQLPAKPVKRKHWTDPRLIMQLPPSRRPKGFVPPEPKYPIRVKLKPKPVDLAALGLGKYTKLGD